MTPHTEHVNKPSQVLDPEPIGFALGLFATLSSAAGLIIQSAQYMKDRRQDRAAARNLLFTADRSLNRIDESYRSLISIFDEHECLNAPFALGRAPILADPDLYDTLERHQSNIFYGGRDLQNALTELVGLLSKSDSEIAMDISASLDEIFQKARKSNRILEFMIELGSMLEIITDFLYRLGERYEFRPTSVRIRLIQDTIHQLRNRLK